MLTYVVKTCWPFRERSRVYEASTSISWREFGLGRRELVFAGVLLLFLMSSDSIQARILDNRIRKALTLPDKAARLDQLTKIVSTASSTGVTLPATSRSLAAAAKGVVASNPAEDLHIPSAYRGDSRVMDFDDVPRFFSVLGPREKAIGGLAIFTGLRR